jgi:uncharacterized protein (TIGR03000 family)
MTAARICRAYLAPVVVALLASAAMAESNARPAPATVEVRLPAEAELWFDGMPTAQTGARRVFATPPLSPGTAYQYNVLARWRGGGRSVVRSQRVVIRAGETVTLDLTPLDRGPGYAALRDITAASAAPSARRDHSSMLEMRPGETPRPRLSGYMSLTDIDAPKPPAHVSTLRIDEPRP